MPLYTDSKYRTDEHIAVMNVTEQDLYMPVDEAAQLSGCEVVIPYTRGVKQQLMNGQIINNGANKAYNRAIIKLVKMVV